MSNNLSIEVFSPKRGLTEGLKVGCTGVAICVMVGVSSSCLLVADGLLDDALKTGEDCIGCKLEYNEVGVGNDEDSKTLTSVVLADQLTSR